MDFIISYLVVSFLLPQIAPSSQKSIPVAGPRHPSRVCTSLQNLWIWVSLLFFPVLVIELPALLALSSLEPEPHAILSAARLAGFSSPLRPFLKHHLKH